MARDTPITTTGVITGKTSGIFLASLPNGKEVTAFLSRDLSDETGTISPGQHVILELTPYDFSTARIAALKRDPTDVS